MKKKQRTILIATAASVGVLALGAYVLRGMSYQTRFLPNTKVMGVAVGGQTVKAADKKLKAHFASQEYRLLDGKTAVATIKAADLKLSDDFTKTLQSALNKQNPWGFTPVKAATKKGSAGNASESEALTSALRPLVENLNKTRKPAQNAAVVSEDGKFVIKKEQNGTRVDLNRLTAVFSSAIASGKKDVDVKQAVEQPTIRSNDRKLTEAKSQLEKIGSIKASVKVQNSTETVPAQTVNSALTYTNGKVSIDQKPLIAYVSQLNDKYATINKTRSFKSTKRGTINVPAGTYGWSLNVEATASKLASSIEGGQDFTTEASYQGVGFDKGADIGDTYIEVDKGAQHEWFYQNGKLVMDTDVVTGKPGQETPTGVFYIWKKERNATLVGEDYKSPVSYWMPIDYTGVGLHDANWQPKFGGDWWVKHGSHGCVNNPPAFMAKLFETVPLKTPVIVIG